MKTQNKLIPNLHLGASKDSLRETLQYIKVTKDKTVVTNSHILVWYDTPEIFSSEFISNIPDGGILIHKDDWSKFKGNVGIYWENVESGMIGINIKNKRPVFIKCSNESKVGKYPEIDAVIPAGDLLSIDKIGVNAQLLALCQDLLLCDSLQLNFRGESKAIELIPRTNDIKETEPPHSGRAIVMPVRLS